MGRPTDFGDWPTGPTTALTREQLELLGSLAISINRSVIRSGIDRTAPGDVGYRKRLCVMATCVAMMVLPEFGFDQVEDMPVELMIVDARSYEGLINGSANFVSKGKKHSPTLVRSFGTVMLLPSSTKTSSSIQQRPSLLSLAAAFPHQTV